MRLSFHFGFESEVLILILLIPDHCLSFYFIDTVLFYLFTYLFIYFFVTLSPDVAIGLLAGVDGPLKIYAVIYFY